MNTNPKEWRIAPASAHGPQGQEGEAVLIPVDFPWPKLAEALDTYKPQGLGFLFSFATQMHFPAYQEASKRGILTAVAMPNNVQALTGLMHSVPIEAVVATREAAYAFDADVRAQGLRGRIRFFLVLDPEGEFLYTELP